MKSEENIDLNVTQDGRRFAGIYSLKMKNPENRKRSYASFIIINALANFFMQQNLKVSNSKNIYKAAKFSEEFEITDLYVNNWRLDVRLAMEDGSFYIPVSHFENEILPDFYVVASIDKELKKPRFVGYVSKNNIKAEKYNYLYFKSNFDNLKNMSDLLQEIREEKVVSFREKDHRFFHTKILSYLDDEADNFTKMKLIHHLVDCPSCRTEMVNFYGFDLIASNFEHNTDLFDDRSLDVIGALDVQREDDEKESEETSFSDDVSEYERNNRAKNEVLIDGLFENTPKTAKNKKEANIQNNILNDVEPGTISPGKEVEIFLQDVPSLKEIEIEEKQLQIKLDNSEYSDSAYSSSDTPQHRSLADSLKDIPDEMFNTEFGDKKSLRRSNSSAGDSSLSNREKIIVDYDEFGQPVYQEKKEAEDTIVEKQTSSSEGDITYTFKKDTQDNVIEASSEQVSEDLVSKTPPQNKTGPNSKSHLLILSIAGLLAIGGVYFFFVLPYNNQKLSSSGDKTESIVNADSTKIDDIIAKNINKKDVSFVKIKSLNWIAKNSLLEDSDFKNYLQLIDKRFRTKFALNSNSITQAPYNNNIVVEVILTPEGIIKTSRIAQSSQVKTIDEAVIQSLKDAISSISIPASTQETFKLKEYYIKILVKL